MKDEIKTNWRERKVNRIVRIGLVGMVSGVVLSAFSPLIAAIASDYFPSYSNAILLAGFVGSLGLTAGSVFYIDNSLDCQNIDYKWVAGNLHISREDNSLGGR